MLTNLSLKVLNKSRVLLHDYHDDITKLGPGFSLRVPVCIEHKGKNSRSACMHAHTHCICYKKKSMRKMATYSLIETVTGQGIGRSVVGFSLILRPSPSKENWHISQEGRLGSVSM